MDEGLPAALVKKQTRWFFVLLGLIIAAGLIWTISPTPKTSYENQDSISGACASNADCREDQFCRVGLCESFDTDTSCEVDADCSLIDVTHRYGCCYEGMCQTPDIASTSWIAVNAHWFEKGQTQYCPSNDQCGPAPGCAIMAPQKPLYGASCVEKKCTKQLLPEKTLKKKP